MKKKILSILILLIAMLFILTGCGKNEDRKEKTSVDNKSSNNEVANIERASDVNDSSSKEIDYVTEAEKQMAMPEEGDTIAIIHVQDYGDIYIKFFEDVAPKACENFITHSKNGYYNGIIFHRVMNEFMIQGGDPTGIGTGGESIWKEEFAEELDESIKPYRGSLCMASRGTKNSPSLGSQFFITQASYNKNMENYLKQAGATDSLIEAYKKYGGDIYDLYYYDKYTVFGQVYEGMDVVDKIAEVETNPKNDKPLTDVIISSIEIKEYSK